MTNFQRDGALSNAHVGSDFEGMAQSYFAAQGIKLQRHFTIPVGVANIKKPSCFDLGSVDPPIIVECKSHNWTQSGNSPSAKLTVWNEAMYLFHVAPAQYRKNLFCPEGTVEEKKPSLLTISTITATSFPIMWSS